MVHQDPGCDLAEGNSVPSKAQREKLSRMTAHGAYIRKAVLCGCKYASPLEICSEWSSWEKFAEGSLQGNCFLRQGSIPAFRIAERIVLATDDGATVRRDAQIKVRLRRLPDQAVVVPVLVRTQRFTDDRVRGMKLLDIFVQIPL